MRHFSRPQQFYRTSRQGFTLVELLVVIAIIGILVSMLLPAVSQVREAARWTSCKNKLRQMGLATQTYQSHFSNFPPGVNLETGASWQAYILPYIDQENVFDMLDTQNDSFKWSSGSGETAISTFFPIFRCPSDLAPEHIESHGAILPERVPSSYIAVSSGTNEEMLTDAGFSASDLSYTNLERTSAGSTSLVELIRSGALTATQDNLVTEVGIEDIPDGLSNSAIVGEAIFDTNLKLSGSQTLDSDHWCIGSYQIDFRGGTGGGGSGNAQDESEVMGSTGVPLNFYHSSRSLTTFTTVDAQQISWSFSSWHPSDSASFAFADGSVQILSAETNLDVYASIGNVADGGFTGTFLIKVLQV